MDSINAWKEKFPLPNPCTLTEALKNQWIKETEYQEWAAQYYKLPILKDSFFEKHPFSADFLDKAQPIAKPSAIPFLEWNNILYVACLEPQDIPTDQKTVFFIVSFKNMEALWQNIQPPVKNLTLQEQTSSEKLEISIQKDQKEKSKKNILNKKNNDDIEFKYIHPLKAVFFSLGDVVKILINFMTTKKKKTKQPPPQMLSHKKNKNLKTSKPTASFSVKTQKHQTPSTNKAFSALKKEPPIALDKNDKDSVQTSDKIKTPVKEDPPSLALNEDSTPQLDNIQPPAEEEERPTPLLNTENSQQPHTQTKIPKPFEKEEAPTPIALEDEISDNPAENSQLQRNSSLESKNKDDKTTLSPAPIPLNTENKDQSLQDHQENSESIKDENLDNKPTNTETPVQISGSFEILDQKKATSLDQLSLLRRPLEETKKYVNSYILFIFKENLFIPYKWSPHLKAQKKAPGSIQKPSIFRIVYMSKQAYFGHIAPILANNSFFNQWGFETLPKHIMLIPFLDTKKQNVLGGYLGISDTRSLPIKILSAVEKILQPLNSHYEDGSLLKKVS